MQKWETVSRSRVLGDPGIGMMLHRSGSMCYRRHKNCGVHLFRNLVGGIILGIILTPSGDHWMILEGYPEGDPG